MSHTRVKTTYASEGEYGSTEYHTLYCDHNHSLDCTTIYDEDGDVESMNFCEWESGNDKQDAMERLLFPFKDKWHGELKDGVEYYFDELDKAQKEYQRKNTLKDHEAQKEKLSIYEFAYNAMTPEERNTDLGKSIIRWINVYKPHIEKFEKELQINSLT